jgi:ABC-2 type transport system ATP-binding protein
VREFMRDMQRRYGTTLLVTTHDLRDITETCDRILLLDRGTLLFDGSLREFERLFAKKRRIVVELERPVSPELVLEVGEELGRRGGLLKESTPHRLVVDYEGEGLAPALTQFLLSRLEVADILLEKADIESIVAGIYRRPNEAAPEGEP